MDAPCSFETKDVVKIDSLCRAMDVCETLKRSEASVMLWEVGLLQEAIGLIDGADLCTSKCFHETILMGSIGSLDTSFSLGRVSDDHGNAKTV